MTPKPLRRALALAVSLTLAAGMALVAAPAAQAVPASSDATLSGIMLSTGSFDPAFDPTGLANSLVTVPNSTTHFSFTPLRSDPGAAVSTWNGNVRESLAIGAATTPSFLRVGNNIMTVDVTSVDGSATKQYTLFVTREAAPAPVYDLSLNNLTVSEGTLNPGFSSSIQSYNVAVPFSTTSITVAPGTSAGNTVTVTNSSNQVGGTIQLAVGNNLALVTVTAPDNTSRQYTVHITRGPAPTADVDLTDIELSHGTLSQPFDSAVLSYSATVPYAVRSMQITPTASDSANTITINNVTVADGQAFTVPLNFDPIGSSFAITVTAPNGVQKIYVVTITRDQPSSNADLTSLSLSAGSLSPAFDNDELDYTVDVPYLTTSTTVTGTVADPTAVFRVNHRDMAPGTPSTPVALKVGQNTILATSTAENGDVVTRTIIVTRAAPDLDLAALTVTGETLSPAFSADTTEYTLALPYSTDSIDVAASAVNPDWTVQIQGFAADSKTVVVPVGTSRVVVTVVAMYNESRSYTINVTREAPSTNAALGGITLSTGTLSPAFSAAEAKYTVTVGYLTEKIIVGAASAETTTGLTINGKAAASAEVALAVGTNTITIVTTAEDGITTKTTTIVVTREAAPAATVDIALGLVAGDAAANAPFTVSASNLLPGSTATITMHSTPVVLATGTVKADGTLTLSARIPAGAEAGAHRLVFAGTAVDGSAVTQTAWFTVLRNGTIGAVSVTEPVAYLEPTPAPAPAPSGGAKPLATTGADTGFGTAAGVSLAALGALLLLGGALRRRRSAA